MKFSAWNIVVLLLPGCGTTIPITQLSNSERGAYEVSLAVDGAGFVAAWYDTRDGNPEIYMRTVGVSGRPTGPERRLTDDVNLSYEPDIALVAEDVVIAWYDQVGERQQARVGRWGRDGSARWVRLLGGGTSSRNPLVRVANDTLFCAWLEVDEDGGVAVWSQWLDASGNPMTTPERLAPAGETTWNLNAVVDEAETWLVFDANVGTLREELFLLRLSGQRRDLLRLTDDDGFASKYPDLVFAENQVAVTWLDERDGNSEVYLLMASREKLSRGGRVESLRITQTLGESIGAYIDWNGGRVGLAWSDDHEGQHEVYFQTFSPDGTAHVSPRRLTDTPSASLIPAIVEWGDGFALAWNEDVIEERGDHRWGGRSDILFATVR